MATSVNLVWTIGKNLKNRLTRGYQLNLLQQTPIFLKTFPQNKICRSRWKAAVIRQSWHQKTRSEKLMNPYKFEKKMLEKLSLSESIVSVLMFDQSFEMFWEI